MRKKIFGVLLFSIMVAPLAAQIVRSRPGTTQEGSSLERFRDSWRVLEPIRRRNLAVYPVVSNLKVNTSEFLTLEEGLDSGAVRIVERGQLGNGLYRRRSLGHGAEDPGGQMRPVELSPASVNELVLLNNSTRPLILLAGEVVVGGKQNRIIGADLVVPPQSDPLPLTVFCVEHGRWSEGAGGFESARTIAHPSIRLEAQAKKSQAGVWDSVARAAGAMGVASPTSSYQDVVNSDQAKREFDAAASSIESDYERELRDQLRGRNAVGVVVAINDELVWSDVFPTQDLFQKYWRKLLRSYLVEAEGRGRELKRPPSGKDAEAFLLEDHGRMNIRVEPGAYRRTEISSDEYQVVTLEALGKFGDPGLLAHYNKMARN